LACSRGQDSLSRSSPVISTLAAPRYSHKNKPRHITTTSQAYIASSPFPSSLVHRKLLLRRARYRQPVGCREVVSVDPLAKEESRCPMPWRRPKPIRRRWEESTHFLRCSMKICSDTSSVKMACPCGVPPAYSVDRQSRRSANVHKLRAERRASTRRRRRERSRERETPAHVVHPRRAWWKG
jgi:hypothetical protein